MSHEEKRELINFLIFLRGKLQSLAIKLLLLGEDPAKVDEAEMKLAERIGQLRIKMMQQWKGDAGALMIELRQSNEKAQRRLRELKDSQNRADKLADILGLIDRGMGALSGLVL